uniref:Uncharacterized protein n=1 Tax=uncultured Armatimonadetes bacterium TaxID=157466 RepID=A0A6J4JEZ0_9BACT|nr:hypothetical protein AVDCRST_MAG63-3317 [uncultured Armatimonadetes bacterium]
MRSPFPAHRRAAARAAVALLFLCLIGGGAGAAERRPLILIFAPTYEYKTLGRQTPEDAQARTSAVQAVRVVRDLLQQSGVVEAVAYVPEGASDNPLFARAAQESKLSIRWEDPAPPERAALAKALGARYLLTVATGPQPGGGVFVEAQAAPVGRGQAWQAREHAQVTRGSVRVGAAAGAAPAPYNDDLMSAANTLILKFLAGPLGSYTRSAPAPATTPAVEAPAPPPGGGGEAEVRALLAQGEALLTEKDADGAVVAFRAAVNLMPRAAAPRIALIRAYLQARRGAEATSEAQRALALIPADDAAGRAEVSGLMAQGLAISGDTTAARATYEKILAARPQTTWARLGLADLLLTQGKVAEAEALYRAVKEREPANAVAAERLARLHATRGDFAAAMKEMEALPADSAVRYTTARDLFDSGATLVAATLAQSRKTFDKGRTSREAFFETATAQAERANTLVSFLKACPPDQNAPSLVRAYRQRVLAASLLAQAAANVLAFIETGDAAADTQATVLLGEARNSLSEARAAEGPRAAAAEAAAP